MNWRIANSARDPRLSLEWVESGGPAVSAPTRRGFGTELIERIVNYELQADVQRDFPKEGVRCTIEFALTDQTGYLLTTKREQT